MGWAGIRDESIDVVIDNFQRAVENDPDNADANAGLAGAYLARGGAADDGLALDAAGNALLINPNYKSHHDDVGVADLHSIRAQAFINLGKYTDSQSEISKALDLDPENKSALALKDLLNLIPVG